jgi:threonine/homoserine/homoserine lactone efflux protein
MPSSAAVLTFFLGTLVFLVVPGPGMLFILGRAIALGPRAALVTAAGNYIGVLVLLAGVSVGVGVLVERVAAALVVLKFVGAAYLIWLGVQAYRHRGRLAATLKEPTTAPLPGRAFVEGSVVGLTNPKAIVFFATVLPQFTDPAQGMIGLQVAVFGLVFCTLAAAMDAGWALGAGTARDWFATSPRRLRRLGGAGGLTMIGLGLGVAATGHHS